MSKITKKFKQNKTENKGTLSIGIVPAYPDLETSFEIAEILIKNGIDILELSASFSDPLADGPTLQQAHAKVLSQKITKAQVFNFYKKIRTNYPELPMFVIEYGNIIYKHGIDNYYKKLKASGVDLILIPDVPLEEIDPYIKASKKYNIDQSYIVAPTTDSVRLKKIIKRVAGFIYVVTITGITGVRKNIADQTKTMLNKISQQTNIPLLAGFGISTPEHVKTTLDAGASGVVICSRLINIINENLDNKKMMLNQIKKFVIAMKQATLK